MAVSRLLAALRETLSDPDDLIRAAGGPLLRHTQANVRAQGLIDTGRLYASLGEGHTENVASVFRTEGDFGTRVPYAALVDARPNQRFMALNQATADDVVSALADALLEDI